MACSFLASAEESPPLFTFGYTDERFLLTFRNEDLLTLRVRLSFGAHRRLNFARRKNVFKFDSVDLNTPRIGRLSSFYAYAS